MTSEHHALKLVPTVEDRIRFMRACPARCHMIDSLDERIDRQRRLVRGILKTYGLTPEELSSIPKKDMQTKDVELQLWYNILRDCDYIDGLR